MKMQKHIFLGQTIRWTLMHFQRVSRSKDFFKILVGEARLWYWSLRPLALDWNGLQTQLQWQHSKIGSTGEKLCGDHSTLMKIQKL